MRDTSGADELISVGEAHLLIHTVCVQCGLPHVDNITCRSLLKNNPLEHHMLKVWFQIWTRPANRSSLCPAWSRRPGREPGPLCATVNMIRESWLGEVVNVR